MKRLIFLLSIIVSLTSVAWANNDVSKQQAARKAQRAHPGKVLSIIKKQSAKGSVYHVKILSKKGRVKSIRIDKKTGKIIKN